jgi:hypothetical protein
VLLPVEIRRVLGEDTDVFVCALALVDSIDA